MVTVFFDRRLGRLLFGEHARHAAAAKAAAANPAPTPKPIPHSGVVFLDRQCIPDFEYDEYDEYDLGDIDPDEYDLGDMRGYDDFTF